MPALWLEASMPILAIGTPVGGSPYSYIGVWAGRPGTPSTGDLIKITDVHALVPVEFVWNGNAWIPVDQPPALQDIYVQPINGTTWAARPNGAVVTLPVWASWLVLVLGANGGGGGSGRRGALGTARSGGQAGPPGVVSRYRIPLRNLTTGVLLATTGILTCSPGLAGGAAVLVDDTNGNAAAGAVTSSVFVYNGITYAANGGGAAASGGATANLTVNQTGHANTVPISAGIGSTNVTAAGSLNFPSSLIASGSGGGSISAANALLAPGGINMLIGLDGSVVTPGNLGFYQTRGEYLVSRGGIGGAPNDVGPAGAGGDGLAGASGGGGGASLNGFASGAGGKGGDGWAVFNWE